MKPVKDALSQIVGRGGRPAIVDMTVEQVRQLDPGICDRLQDTRLLEPIACDPHLHRTVGELAQAEQVDVGVLRTVEASPASPPEARQHEAHRVWPGPRLAAPVSELDLAHEIEELWAEPAWQEFDRNAKTLVKNPDLRIVLLTLKAGSRLDEHQAPGGISIQMLSGRVRVQPPSERVELTAGEYLPVGPVIRHDLEAIESSAVLLTITQPPLEEHPMSPVVPAREAPPAAVPARHLSPDEQAMLTEADLRPIFDTEVAGNCFAPIEGYMIVKSGPTDFRHHGFYVVDEPYAGMKPKAEPEGYAEPMEHRLGARIPGEVMPGAVPVDLASRSLIPPTPAELGITNSVDASYPDLRHLARGGPHMASR